MEKKIENINRSKRMPGHKPLDLFPQMRLRRERSQPDQQGSYDQDGPWNIV
uniref:Uncharacterized protein n=1 Tax=Candidatus Kentrum sp. FW TaxID=2126338 RepID=A0A450SYW2_9GAMM|nr:MAG: hypothetical protein BECKFW1821B_GA0114236_104732 [Candidatus Kentron sp. FW]